MTFDFVPRPSQRDILTYKGGLMGISAVPGSGKTWTLSLLAAELIRNQLLDEGQEILVVTLVNSAVNNFSQRISSFLQSFGMIPSLGYRVRTLHGLAHDIVKERPELVGLDASFQICDERESNRLRNDAVNVWLLENSTRLDSFLNPELSNQKKLDLLRKDIPKLIDDLSNQFIRSIKNTHITPYHLKEEILTNPDQYPLAEIGFEIYEIYQRSLEYRGVVDFDDLILKAYRILKLDKSLCERLQAMWPFILEDEAQDSSLMQQKILHLLAAKQSGTNWVRVGDPNQAIYESFTTADPSLFVDFVSRADQQHLLPHSGRNTKSIINLANDLVDWSNHSHPMPQARNALVPNHIEPAPPGDIQPNPSDKPEAIHLYSQALGSEEELRIVASSVTRFLADNPEKTVAVLAPRNARGKSISNLFRTEFNIEPVELLNTTLATRKTAGALVRVLLFMQEPVSSSRLAAAFETYHRSLRQDPDIWKVIESLSKDLSKTKSVESFVAPDPGSENDHLLQKSTPEEIQLLKSFQSAAILWLDAAILPLDQQILTIANSLFTETEDIALIHRISVFVKQTQNRHPDWDQIYLIDELKALARNERRFYSSPNSDKFDPAAHKGKVVVTTAHKAKGLEWDRVYLISANNYNFPSGKQNDRFISEKWFIRDGLNLPAETLAQLDALITQENGPYQEGEATSKARIEFIRERLRLLYVSITRAREDLIVTWNTGRSGNQTPSVPLTALQDSLKDRLEHAD